MSAVVGPFFMRSAADHMPLMPASPREAARYSALAQTVPHHAFTVYQLTRALAQPQLRPLVVAVELDAHAADLYLVAQSTRAMHEVLRVVVDLSYHPEATQDVRGVIVPPAQRYASAVAWVIRSLQTVAPISHTLLPLRRLFYGDPPALDDYTRWQRHIVSELLIQLVAQGIDFLHRPTARCPEAPRRRALYRTVAQFMHNPTRAPTFAARLGGWRYPPLTSTQAECIRADDDAAFAHHRREVVVQARRDDGSIIHGIHDGTQVDDAYMIFAPLVGHPLSVWWQTIWVAASRVVQISADVPVRFVAMMHDDTL